MGRAVAKDEKAGLFAVHEFLDHHFGPGAAEFAAEHVVKGGLGLGQGHGDDHALACGQTVGLDHDGGTLGFDIAAGGGEIGEMGVGGGGGACGVADGFGKALRGLKPCGGGGGAKDQQSGVAQAVGDTGGQGRLGADDDEINRLGLAKAGDDPAVENVERRTFGDFRDARIAGGHDQPIAFGVLQHRPGKRMFPPARSKD